MTGEIEIALSIATTPIAQALEWVTVVVSIGDARAELPCPGFSSGSAGDYSGETDYATRAELHRSDGGWLLVITGAVGNRYASTPDSVYHRVLESSDGRVWTQSTKPLPTQAPLRRAEVGSVYGFR